MVSFMDRPTSPTSRASSAHDGLQIEAVVRDVQGDQAAVGELGEVDPSASRVRRCTGIASPLKASSTINPKRASGLATHRDPGVAEDDSPVGPAVLEVVEIRRVAGDSLDGRIDFEEGVFLALAAVSGERADSEADHADAASDRRALIGERS